MKDTITDSSVVAAAEDQVSSDLNEEVAILNLEAGVYYSLQDVGVRIWNLIQRPRAVGEIQDILVEEYDVEPERCKRDVLSLLQELADAGLVTKVKDEIPE